MAVLHRKEEKIQAVLGRLSKKYTPDDFVTMFIKLYSKDWGKIKSAYIKASQDKEPGTVIHMPKPELYLKQILEIFLTQQTIIPEEVIVESKPATVKTPKIKANVKKTETEAAVKTTAVKKIKAIASKVVKEETPSKTVEVKTDKSVVKKVKVTTKKNAD